MPLAELQGAITLPRPAALQLNLKNGSRIVLHAPRAAAIQIMIQAFCQEFKKVSKSVELFLHVFFSSNLLCEQFLSFKPKYIEFRAKRTGKIEFHRN